MTQDEFLHYLTQLAREHGSQKALAEDLGINAAWLSDILRRRRDPGHKLLEALGFRKIVTYERITEGGNDATSSRRRCSRHNGAA